MASDLADFANRPSERKTRPIVTLQLYPELRHGEKEKCDKMAGAIRELMEPRQCKGENPKAANLQNFAAFYMRDVENSKHMMDVGSYGGDLAACVKRTTNTRANSLIADGVRFPITHRLLRAPAEVDCGTVNTGAETDGSSKLGDYSYRPNGKIGRYHLGGENGDVARGSLATNISEFADMDR